MESSIHPSQARVGETEKKYVDLTANEAVKGTHDLSKRVDELVMLENVAVYQHFIMLVTIGSIIVISPPI